ncbi:DUF1003 domain-containing protein [Sphingobacterium sp. MYb382]|uniref:DUF1003 domain-containing protein n=1 Tax=Sphingobacterium sp. MYb382 TaxID=2745278 RepID=UPI0030AB0ED5
MKTKASFVSAISQKKFPQSEEISGAMVRNPILSLIQADYPNFNESQSIAISELNVYRQKYIAQYLSKEIGNLSSLEEKVVNSMGSDAVLTRTVEEDNTKYTFGQIVADKVATFGGSWTFIIFFSVFIAIWIGANIYFLHNKGFDPYPFILLNLILSCLAALQAPVIMMSQNRQEEKDRARAKKDYMINLKSELEIRLLHEKLDHLIQHQQQELIEIQQVQIEMMDDILSRINK